MSVAIIAAALGFLALLFCLGLAHALVALVALAIVVSLLRYFATRQTGGQTGDVLGAVEQVSEIVILLAALRVVSTHPAPAKRPGGGGRGTARRAVGGASASRPASAPRAPSTMLRMVPPRTACGGGLSYDWPRRQQARADDDGERDQAGRDGERQTDRGNGGGGGPADGGKSLGEGGDARGDLAAAEISAALGLRAKPELDRGSARSRNHDAGAGDGGVPKRGDGDDREQRGKDQGEVGDHGFDLGAQHITLRDRRGGNEDRARLRPRW